MEDLTSVRYLIASVLAAIGVVVAFGPEIVASMSRLRAGGVEEPTLAPQSSAATN